ncbi:TPA: hypothetical protein VGT23_003370 [Vibrio cholerae]|nr:hypothetical protein [Vibrio cholerae]HEQ3579750.1 hypothetical protein [Vibrio cholerae]
MNVLIKLIKKNSSSMLQGFKLPFSLINFFQVQTKVEYIKIAVNIFLGKFINMAVMFMPLKLLFVLTGTKNIEILAKIESAIGRGYYIGFILVTLFILYVSNIILQIYRVKLVRLQSGNIEDKDYVFYDKLVSSNLVKATYPSYCQVLGDFTIILVVLLCLFSLHAYFSIYFLSVILFFSLVYEQWVFSSHETNLMKKLGIDKKSFIQVMSMMMFLVLFIGLILVVLTTEVGVIKAILLLLLVRLANSSFKSYLSCHMKLRECYL